MRIAWIGLSLIMFLAAPVAAQEPTPAAPTVAALDAARLQILELAIENLTLKLDALKRDAEAFVRTLQREGYELRKENGQWVYRPAPAAPPPTTPPPPPRQE